MEIGLADLTAGGVSETPELPPPELPPPELPKVEEAAAGGEAAPLPTEPTAEPPPAAPPAEAPKTETVPAPPAAPAAGAALTREVAMIVPENVKDDRKIEFVVDGVKYSAVLPEGLKAGETFRARIPVAAAPPTVIATAETKRPAAESKADKPPSAKKQKTRVNKKKEMKSDDEDAFSDEADEDAGQEDIQLEERIAVRRPRRSSAGSVEDATAMGWGEHTSAGGIRYWYNIITSKTSWDKPRGWVPGQVPKKPEEPAAAAAAPPAAAESAEGNGA